MTTILLSSIVQHPLYVPSGMYCPSDQITPAVEPAVEPVTSQASPGILEQVTNSVIDGSHEVVDFLQDAVQNKYVQLTAVALAGITVACLVYRNRSNKK